MHCPEWSLHRCEQFIWARRPSKIRVSCGNRPFCKAAQKKVEECSLHSKQSASAVILYTRATVRSGVGVAAAAAALPHTPTPTQLASDTMGWLVKLNSRFEDSVSAWWARELAQGAGGAMVPFPQRAQSGCCLLDAPLPTPAIATLLTGTSQRLHAAAKRLVRPLGLPLDVLSFVPGLPALSLGLLAHLPRSKELGQAVSLAGRAWACPGPAGGRGCWCTAPRPAVSKAGKLAGRPHSLSCCLTLASLLASSAARTGALPQQPTEPPQLCAFRPRLLTNNPIACRSRSLSEHFPAAPSL